MKKQPNRFIGRSLRLLWRVFLGVIILLAYGRTLAQTPGVKTDNKKYLSLLLLNLSEDKDYELEVIRQSANAGMNSIVLTVWWDKVYRNSPAGPGDWSRFDNQVKLATQLGMKVGLRIFLGRNSSYLNGFWTDAQSARDSKQNPLREVYNYTHFSLLHTPSVNKGADFVKETAQRFKYLVDEDKILFMSVVITPTQEIGYHYSNFPPPGEDKGVYQAAFDYSDYYKVGFSEWLKGKYKKIVRLNLLWGSQYKSFEEVQMPATPWEPKDAFFGRRGKDWYLFRHLVMKQFNDRMIQIIKDVNKDIPYVNEFGSVIDAESALRATYAFPDLSTKVDGIKIHDSPFFDHRWTMDVIRSNARPDQWVMNEVFYNAEWGHNEYYEQIDECFESGAKLVAFVLSTPGHVSAVRDVIQNSAKKWLNKPMTPVVATDTVSYVLSRLIDKNAWGLGVYDDWKKIARGGSTPKPVHVQLVSDLLKDEYWLPAANRNPYLLNPIPMQIIAVNRDFAYQIPTDTFGDEDGTVVKIEVASLPSWLRYEGGQLKGLPTVMGDSRILVRGTDDEGGTTEAYLTIRVDTRENANKPPIVKKNLANITTATNKPFVFKLPSDLFSDPDGKVTRIEASGLPAWLTFTNEEFQGLPTQTGDFRVALKAYDDLEAFVEIYFIISVVEPQFVNNAPFVQGTLPVRFAKVNEPFLYALPINLFGDSDGYITLITAQNLPTWLTFSLNEFSGTPRQQGEYRIILRAYDNAGGYVETPLVIRAEVPKITFDLMGSGKLIDRKFLRTLKEGDELPAGSLPGLLNIYAFGNFEFDQIDFTLTGPYRSSATAWKFPYALYRDESGFVPYIGSYTIYASAYKGIEHILTNTIHFSITPGDSLQPNLLLEDWQGYPNPFESVFNIKLPENQPQTSYSFSLINASGQHIPILARWVTVQKNIAQIDLLGISVSSGIYILRVESGGELLRTFRVMKR